MRPPCISAVAAAHFYSGATRVQLTGHVRGVRTESLACMAAGTAADSGQLQGLTPQQPAVLLSCCPFALMHICSPTAIRRRCLPPVPGRAAALQKCRRAVSPRCSRPTHRVAPQRSARVTPGFTALPTLSIPSTPALGCVSATRQRAGGTEAAAAVRSQVQDGSAATAPPTAPAGAAAARRASIATSSAWRVACTRNAANIQGAGSGSGSEAG